MGSGQSPPDLFEGMRRFRAQLATGAPQICGAVTFNDPLVSDALADSVDMLWYDLEHNALDPAALNAHLLAARYKQTATIVRVADVHPAVLKPVLDAGATGIVAAQVHTVDEVEQLVRNCMYPPDGTRGCGPRVPTNFGRAGGTAYLRMANQTIFTSVMIETAEALDAIDQIVRVPRLDSVVIGPSDLAGAIDQLDRVDGPAVNEAIDRVIAAAKAAGIYVGMGMPADTRFASTMIARGVNWIQFGSDFEYMIQHIDANVESLRNPS